MKKRLMVSGGLGNQMFQYAFYLSLKKRGIPVDLDLSEFILNSSHNGFELKSVFGIQDNLKVFPLRIRALYYLYRRLYMPMNSYPERIFTYNADVYDCSYKFLNGCWLSAEYFRDIEDEVRHAFIFKDIEKENLHIAEYMRQQESVSIHIRRGDYLKLPRYCVCDDIYYKRSIDKILSLIKSPYFYVFSDDKEWSGDFMEKLGVPFKLITWNNGSQSYQDMFLMSKCKHNIIANSTFSWWGAWLNNYKNKVVVAPSTWFTTREVRIDCPGWEIIEVNNV